VEASFLPAEADREYASTRVLIALDRVAAMRIRAVRLPFIVADN